MRQSRERTYEQVLVMLKKAVAGFLTAISIQENQRIKSWSLDLSEEEITHAEAGMQILAEGQPCG